MPSSIDLNGVNKKQQGGKRNKLTTYDLNLWSIDSGTFQIWPFPMYFAEKMKKNNPQKPHY